MAHDLKENVKSTSTWRRALYMVLYAVFYGFGEAVLFLVVVFQFLHSLFTGERNEMVLEFSENLCAWLYEVMLYLTYNSEDQPFPFAPWPNEVDSAQAPAFEGEDVRTEGDDDFAEDERASESVPEFEGVMGEGPTEPVVPAPVVRTEPPSEPAVPEEPERSADGSGTSSQPGLGRD